MKSNNTANLGFVSDFGFWILSFALRRAVVLSLLLITPVWAVERQLLSGHVPASAARLQPVRRLPGSNRLNLTIGLPLRNQGALTALLEQLYDPASPQYRHYLSPEYASDITDYESLTGLPNVSLKNVLTGGFDGTPTSYGNSEVALDIEMAISMAPGLLQVLVYEGNGSYDILNRIATDNAAKQISSSWTLVGDATTDQIFKQYAAQGQSFFQASGDGGVHRHQRRLERTVFLPRGSHHTVNTGASRKLRATERLLGNCYSLRSPPNQITSREPSVRIEPAFILLDVPFGALDGLGPSTHARSVACA